MAGLVSGVSSAWPGHVFRDALLQDILYLVLGGQRRKQFFFCFYRREYRLSDISVKLFLHRFSCFCETVVKILFLVSGRRISFIKLTGISVFIARFVEGDIHLAGVIVNASTVELLQHLGN